GARVDMPAPVGLHRGPGTGQRSCAARWGKAATGWDGAAPWPLPCLPWTPGARTGSLPGSHSTANAHVAQPLGHGAESHDVAEYDRDRAAHLACDPAVVQLDGPLRVTRRARVVGHQDDGQVPLHVEAPQQVAIIHPTPAA